MFSGSFSKFDVVYTGFSALAIVTVFRSVQFWKTNILQRSAAINTVEIKYGEIFNDKVTVSWVLVKFD